jgi:RND family efflux transporter MFP subunit
MTNTLRISGMAALLLLGACTKQAETAAPEPAALIKTALVTSGATEQSIVVYGAVENAVGGKYTVAAPVEADVVTIEAPAGSAVRQGQVVARLRPSPASQLAYATARVNASAAELALARARRLRADGLVSNAEVESARAAALSAGATRASLGALAGGLALRAPVSGTVESIGASPGQLVAPGTPVLTLVKGGDLRARFGIDPAVARSIQPSSNIEIAGAQGAAPFTVPVLSIDRIVDAATKQASLFVRIPAQARIGAGESLSGRLMLSGNDAGITLPYVALLDDGGQPYVYVIAKGVAHRRDIVAGSKMGDRVGVTSGLKPGETIATDGLTSLEDGMRVRTR